MTGLIGGKLQQGERTIDQSGDRTKVKLASLKPACPHGQFPAIIAGREVQCCNRLHLEMSY